MRVLHAIHDFLPRHRSGSEVYAYQLCRRLARDHDVQVLCAEHDPARPHGSLVWRVHQGLPVVELINNWAFPSFTDTYASRRLSRVLDHVLEAVQPDVLHVHSLLNLSFDLPALARARGVPVVSTLHDYSLVCPSGGQRLHVAEQHVCHVIDPDRCRRCFVQSPFHARLTFARLSRRTGGAAGAMRVLDRLRRHAPRIFEVATRAARWVPAPALTHEQIVARLAHAGRVFETVDHFVAPSASLAAEFRQLGVPADRLTVSDNGQAPLPVARRRPRGDRLRIGFVGTLVWHKGAHVLLEAVRLLPAGRFEVSLFGHLDWVPGYVTSLRAQARGLPVRFRGPFGEAAAGAVYAELDVLVVPSLWPENSPLVIHEAFQAGVPVVAARVGGIPELVTDGRNGLLHDAGSPIELAACLRRLMDRPAELAALTEGIPRVKTIDEDAVDWTARYQDVVARRRGALAPSGLPTGAAAAPDTAAVVLNFRTLDDTWLAIRSLRASRTPVRDLVVVDNGSGDGSVAALRERDPGLAVVALERNLGFSGGCNAGIRLALARGARHVLLLNSDAVMPPDGIGRLEAALASDPRLGIVGALIVSRAEPGRVLSRGITFAPTTGRFRHLGFGELRAPGPTDAVTPVDGVTGCAMLVRREVFEAIGLLDEDYFFGFEDLDLCLRARVAGFGTACAQGVVVLHEGGRSIGARSMRWIYFGTRNHLLLARRAAPLGDPVRTWLRDGAILAVNLAHVLISSPAPLSAGLPGFVRGALDHLSGHYGEGPPA